MIPGLLAMNCNDCNDLRSTVCIATQSNGHPSGQVASAKPVMTGLPYSTIVYCNTGIGPATPVATAL